MYDKKFDYSSLITKNVLKKFQTAIVEKFQVDVKFTTKENLTTQHGVLNLIITSEKELSQTTQLTAMMFKELFIQSTWLYTDTMFRMNKETHVISGYLNFRYQHHSGGSNGFEICWFAIHENEEVEIMFSIDRVTISL